MPATATARRNPHGPARTRRTGRDVSSSDDPECFGGDRRAARPILAFGHGIHLCPGAPLARLQIRVALEGLLTRFRSVRLAEDNSYHYVRSHILRGLAGLWLELKPA